MKRVLLTVVVCMAILALAAPAFAAGYNNGEINYTTGLDEAGYADNAGQYVRQPATSAQTTAAAGPHGNYTTTTNKCSDCHSTHYAKGSYMLLRANSREDACSFCHAGGGGSTLNIQMDNQYDASGVVADGSRGSGTGHTLGYAGNSPADINPAYTDAEGLACFDCHSPHGNSARILTTFANPGRATFNDAGEETAVGAPAGSSHFWVTKINGSTGAAAIAKFTSYTSAKYGVVYDLRSYVPVSGTDVLATSTIWGLAPVEGNFVITKPVTGAEIKPVWGTGRFLLVKNPDAKDGSDETTSGPGTYGGGEYALADNGLNKLSIDWADPLGPANPAYGGNQDNDGQKFPSASTGILAVSEMCTDCHDGAAGSAGQAANVWLPSAADTSTGSYQVAYSHDAQPRH